MTDIKSFHQALLDFVQIFTADIHVGNYNTNSNMKNKFQSI